MAARAFTNADEPFCIGILGDDPFGDFLDETVRGEKVNGHPFVVQRYRNAEDIKNCGFCSSAIPKINA